MSKVLCEREDLVAIADAIRGKSSETAEMSLAAMPGKIAGISGGQTVYEGSCTVTFPNNNLGVSFYFIDPNGSFGSKITPPSNSSFSIQILKNTILMADMRCFGKYTYICEGQPCTPIEPANRDGCGIVVHGDVALRYSDNAPD